MKRPMLNLNQIGADAIREARRRFLAEGLVRLPLLLSPQDRRLLLDEAVGLLDACGKRRDFKMEQTDGSPRRMRNVGGKDVAARSPMLCELYNDRQLRELVSAVIGEPALACPYDQERIVVTSLQQIGDTHGWHWDDYSIALVWVLQAPPIASGGLVQCVPHTRWNRDAPQILEHIVSSPIRTYYFDSGEIYLMQTRDTLHRVHPIVKLGCERIIMNFAYATKADTDLVDNHETVDALWAAA
ncbi:MAG: hypothetical protein JSR59_01625 [Proteobacteria bacterium]|nr:hypothetical protein [Pseudomonadota bacterium]